MATYDKVNSIIQQAIPLKEGFSDKDFDEYISSVDSTTSKIMSLFHHKTAIEDMIPNPNKPLWLWHKGRKEPVLAVYRDHGTGYFYELAESDYIHSGNSIELSRATHFMYVNQPEEV